MNGTIVVGVDDTAPSRAALRWSVDRASVAGAELAVVHVLDDGWLTISTRMREELRKDAERLLERESEFALSRRADLTVRTQLLGGSTTDELVSAARNADMLVVGTHKTGFINGKIFGSRSLQLAAAAHTPVAVIPQSSQRDGRGIVVGIDGSAAGRLAIRFAAREAESRGELLTLLRAFTVPHLPQGHEVEQRELDRTSEALAVEMLAEAALLAASEAPTVEVRSRSVSRPAAEALVDVSSSAALLVIGNSRRNDAARMVGSVIHDVLINQTSPTIIVHDGDRL